MTVEGSQEAVSLQLDDSLASKALCRLSCMAARSGFHAEEVRKALEALSAAEHLKMVTYLTNGSNRAPEDAEASERCYALRFAADFLQRARENEEIGLTEATRTLLRVYEEVEREFRDKDEPMAPGTSYKATCR